EAARHPRQPPMASMRCRCVTNAGMPDMTQRSPIPTGLLALCLVATAAAAAPPAKQRLRDRILQRMQPQTEAAGHGERAPLPPGVRVERDIAYGPDPRQRYDVYLPAHARPDAPILFMVHGGGWRRG